jgi:hypothetical protein
MNRSKRSWQLGAAITVLCGSLVMFTIAIVSAWLNIEVRRYSRRCTEDRAERRVKSVRIHQIRESLANSPVRTPVSWVGRRHSTLSGFDPSRRHVARGCRRIPPGILWHVLRRDSLGQARPRHRLMTMESQFGNDNTEENKRKADL